MRTTTAVDAARQARGKDAFVQQAVLLAEPVNS